VVTHLVPEGERLPFCKAIASGRLFSLLVAEMFGQNLPENVCGLCLEELKIRQ